MKDNSKTVFSYVKEHGAENITAQDIADATGLPIRSVNGIVTSAFQRKGIMQRTPAEVENADGTHSQVKLITLTDEYADATIESLEAEEAVKAAEKAAAKASE